MGSNSSAREGLPGARGARFTSRQEETGSGSGTVIATAAACALLRILRILNPQWPTLVVLIMIGYIGCRYRHIRTLHTLHTHTHPDIVYIDCAAPNRVEQGTVHTRGA